MATGRVLSTVKDSDLNVAAPLAAAAVKDVRGKDSGEATTKRSSSGRMASVGVPSILNPVQRQTSRSVRKEASNQRSLGTAVTAASVTTATIPVNSTLGHQPLGQKDWLRGSAVSTSTAYEAWREGTSRGKGTNRFEDDDDSSNWNRDPLLEEDVFDIFQLKEERFAPEEVETLVSIITEKDNELTLSSASEDEENGGALEREETETEVEGQRGQLVEARAAKGENGKERQPNSSYPGSTESRSAAGDFPSTRDGNTYPNEPSSSLNVEEDEFSLFQLNGADLSSHMKGLLDRIVKLELEKERATKKLSDWAQCAHELQDLYTLKGGECKAKEALVAKLRRDLDKNEEDMGQLRTTLSEREKLADELRQELVVKDQLLKESHENCNMLRSALVDAELELDRQEKVTLSIGSGEEPNQQSQSASEEIKSRMCDNLKADLVRKDLILSKRNEKIMKQEFELERSKVQIFQQKQQIEMLTQELSRLRNQGTSSEHKGESAKGGDAVEEEKGKLIEELAHQIEEGSREIKIIQEELQAANPKIFSEES